MYRAGVSSAVAELHVDKAAGSSGGAEVLQPTSRGAVHISWDFSCRCWTSIVTLDNDVKRRQLKPAHIDIAEASMVMDDVHDVKRLSYASQKNLAYKILERWAADILRDMIGN